MDHNRWFEIDLIKAVCILGVIYIHALSRVMITTDPIGLFLGDWTRFAVPGFIFAAGFLFKKGEVDTADLAWRLLARIIPPYLVCSLVFIFLGVAERGVSASRGEGAKIATDLLFGNAIGIYYFVFVISYLYAFSFLLRLCSSGMVLGLWFLSAALTVWFYLNPLNFIPAILKQILPKEYYELYFILLRHPCVHLLFYLSGWAVNLYYDRIRPALSRNFIPLVAAAVAADIIALYVIHRSRAHFSLWQLTIQVHIALTLLCVMAVGIKGRFRVFFVDYLSRNTYAIFLLHFPFVRMIQNLFPEITVRFSLFHSSFAWLGGLFGSVVVITIAKLVFRKYSPYIVGA
ncbi:MAG: acyltransferase family protein [Deltaproteobacteria bacterium]|nr:acyltransferase family protein [Deltaproteobacteria bacterium]